MSPGTALAFLSSKGFQAGFVRSRSGPDLLASSIHPLLELWRQRWKLALRTIDEDIQAQGDKGSDTQTCSCNRQGVCGLDSDKVARKNFTRLELQDRHCNNFCFLTALGRFGRIQTKGVPATPPPLCHVGSFRGHQGSPTDLLSCQGTPLDPPFCWLTTHV